MKILSTLSIGLLLCVIISCIFFITCKLKTRERHTAAEFADRLIKQNNFPEIHKNQPDGTSRQVKMAYPPYLWDAESATPEKTAESGQREQRLSLQLLHILLLLCMETKAVTALLSVCVIGLFKAHATRLRIKAVSELIWGV